LRLSFEKLQLQMYEVGREKCKQMEKTIDIEPV
jgi:hypothetical protein